MTKDGTMLKLTMTLALTVAFATFLLTLGCHATRQDTELTDASMPVQPAHHALMFAWSPTVDPVTYQAGDAGTVTVPTGVYVTSWGAHATSSGAYATVAPSGPSIADAATGPAIPIPAGGGYNAYPPAYPANANALGPGTVFVFSGTDSYTVWQYAIGGP